MKIIRYRDAEGTVGHAALQGERAFALQGDLFGEFSVSDREVAVAKLLAPVVPSQIICIGLNYRQHALETNAPIPERPVMFVKGANTLQNPLDAILIPTFAASHKVDYECELAVVIGQAAKNVTPENALDYVLGYTAANDVSARDWQIDWGGSQWCRGKFFDTFCPLGPVLALKDEIPDPNALNLKTVLNGETVQNSNTADMIFNVKTLVAWLSGSTTLLPGTVILTGTPQGVGMAAKPPRWLKPGDEVTIEIEKIGALTNSVALEAA